MRKNVVLNSSFELDMSADATADEIGVGGDGVGYLDNIGLLLSWTGSSPVGNFYVQVSNDNKKVTSANASWFNLTFDNGVVAISGNSGDHQININQVPFTRMRFFYDRTSGTGTLTVKMSAKMV